MPASLLISVTDLSVALGPRSSSRFRTQRFFRRRHRERFCRQQNVFAPKAGHLVDSQCGHLRGLLHSFSYLATSTTTCILSTNYRCFKMARVCLPYATLQMSWTHANPSSDLLLQRYLPGSSTGSCPSSAYPIHISLTIARSTASFSFAI